jgi:hypothetical protein
MLQQRHSKRELEHFTTTNKPFDGANYDIAENRNTRNEVIKEVTLTPRKHLQQNTVNKITMNQTHQNSAMIAYGLDRHHHDNINHG